MKVTHATNDQVSFSGDIHFDVLTGTVTRGPKPADTSTSIIPTTPIRLGYREAVPQLQISMTDACNMGCTYCSFRQRIGLDGKPINMPLDRARRAIDFFVNNLTSSDAYARIDFGLSGEPMLRRGSHDTLQGWIQQALTRTSVSIAWSGPMVTNATLALTDQHLLESLGPPQDISCDGPQEVHDAFRPYVDGRGTYSDVRKVIDIVLARHPDMGVSAVLTARFNKFDEIFLHLFEELGFRSIYMKPVNVAYSENYGLNPNTLQLFMDGYERLVDLFLGQSAANRLSYLLAVSPEDFFMRYFYRVKDRARQVYRCGAGKSGTYVDTNGKLYPCAHFIGKKGWDIGDIETGFDESKRNRFLQAHVDTREPCKSCWARYVCGGGCYYQAVLANGDMETPDLVKCDLIRFLTTQAMRLLDRLEAETPEVLDALPTPWLISAGDVETHPDTPYRPLSRLSKVDGTFSYQMSGPGRAERGIVDSRASATIELQQVAGALRLSFTPNSWLNWKTIQLWFLDLGKDDPRFRDLAVLKPSIKGTLISVSGDSVPRLFNRPIEQVRRVPFGPDVWTEMKGAKVHICDETVELTVPLDIIFGRDIENDQYGLNIYVGLENGGRIPLSRYEPFMLVDAAETGWLLPSGPEFDQRSVHARSLNLDPPLDMIPLSRWNGMQGNVC